MTGESEDPNPGVACPACGCRHLRSGGVRRSNRLVIRHRTCRNCGRTVKTIEKAVPDGDPGD